MSFKKIWDFLNGHFENNDPDFSPAEEAGSLKKLIQSAESGDSIDQYNLGLMYEIGQGVPQDDYQAFKWYFKAAKQGLVQAQYNVGNCYLNGIGVPQSFTEAKIWFEEAAEQNDGDALFNLGLMYMRGDGVRRSYLKSHEYLVKACEQHEAKAFHALAYLYKTGKGVAINPIIAYACYNESIDLGMDESIELRDNLESNMSTDEILKAQQINLFDYFNNNC